MSTDIPALPPASQSRTTDFFQGLRAEILTGRRPPGMRIQLQQLSDEFKVSLSPIREGLSRLVAEGLLVPAGQRGYHVAAVSEAELVDVRNTRLKVETMALRESMAQGDEEWELRLMAAYQRLLNFEERRWQAGEVDAWEERHHAFHTTLISACDSSLLIRFCRQLHEISDRYRRVYLTVYDPLRNGLSDRNAVMEEHKQLYEASMARNADLACETLRRHIELTTEKLMAVMRTNDRHVTSRGRRT